LVDAAPSGGPIARSALARGAPGRAAAGMDDARKLLDSLMGGHRNAGLKEAKKRKGNNFKDDNVCKFYLVGFCPAHEELFHNTKRDLGECENMHSEAMLAEFEAHPDKERLQVDYERQLRRYLEIIIRGADEWVARELRNIATASETPNEVAKVEIGKLQDRAKALIAEAEELAEAGDIAGSRERMSEAEDFKQKALDWEEKAKNPSKTAEVCHICGLRTDNSDVEAKIGQVTHSHLQGKTHLGYVKIREWHQKLMDRQKERDREEDKGDRRDRRDRRSDGRPDRSRSRDRDRGDRPAANAEPSDKASNGAAKAEEEAADVRRDRDRGATDLGDRDRDRGSGARDRGDPDRPRERDRRQDRDADRRRPAEDRDADRRREPDRGRDDRRRADRDRGAPPERERRLGDRDRRRDYR